MATLDTIEERGGPQLWTRNYIKRVAGLANSGSSRVATRLHPAARIQEAQRILGGTFALVTIWSSRKQVITTVTAIVHGKVWEGDGPVVGDSNDD